MDLLQHRLRVNTSVFYLDYQKHRDLVLASQCNLASDPNAGTPYQLNGGLCPTGTPLAGTPGISPWFVYSSAPASIKGAEVQITANPIEPLSIFYTFGFNQFRSKTTNRTDPSFVDTSVRQQPDMTMSGGIQYAFGLPSGGTLTPHLDFAYQSYQTNGPLNQHQIDPDWIVPSYTLFNAQLTYRPNAGKWEVSVAGTNIFNKFYWEQLGAATSGTPPALNPAVGRVGTPGLPREWSVSFKKNF